MIIKITIPKRTRTPQRFSLTVEQMRVVIRKTVRFLGLPVAPEFRIRDTRRGRAHTVDGYFTVPVWALNRNAAYASYYIVHELCHFRDLRGTWLSGPSQNRPSYATRGHGPEFRRLENAACEALDIRPFYNERGPYVKRVESLGPEPEYNI